MKQKLLTLLAVLLTGGILVACGPGDETTADGGGAGIVDEPVVDQPLGDADDTFTADTAETDTADDVDINAETTDAEVGTDATADAEADTFGENETEEVAADDTEVELDLADEGDAEGEPVAEGDQGEEVAGGGAAAPAGEAIVITFSQAAEGVAVENVDGGDAESIADTEESNPDLNLSTGQRYEFVYDGEGDLVFYNSDGEALLSTTGQGAFVDDSEVSAQAEDGRISFTMTEDLAQEIDRYAAGPEEQGGSVNAN